MVDFLSLFVVFVKPLSVSSIRRSNMDEDLDLLKHMDGLEESMKLIMVTLNIQGVNNQRAKNVNFGALGGSSIAENLVKDNTPAKPHNECLQQELKEDKVIVGTLIVERVG